MPGTNLWIPFQIQLDSTGSGELEVGAPALGYNWQAFCTLNPAPSGQSQTISVSGQVVASGARQSGPFAAGSGQGVTVTIAGGTASSAVAGVLQGAILPGMAAQAPLPGNGNLFEISGGMVDVSGSDVTIQAGQNGVNVSTDAPPVPGPNITIPAGQSSVTETLHPLSNATAIGFAFEPIGSFTLIIKVQDALTLVYLEDFTFAAGGSTGRSFTIPLTPGMTESGIIVTATAGGTVVVNTTVGYSLWYIGTNSIQPVNYPTQPLYVTSVAPQYNYTTSGAPNWPTGLTTLVTGIAGQSIRVRKGYWTPNASGANMAFADSSTGTQFYFMTGLASVPFPIDLQGWAISAGADLQFLNDSGTVQGGALDFTYDQY